MDKASPEVDGGEGGGGIAMGFNRATWKTKTLIFFHLYINENC